MSLKNSKPGIREEGNYKDEIHQEIIQKINV